MNIESPNSGSVPAKHSPGKRLIAIVGATASGKTAAAVLIAKRFNGEIINADSRLFYEGMEIGTARPSDEELDSVPHHLIGFLSPGDSYSISEFLAAASEKIVEVNGRSNLPVIAGGTGQYLWGLLEGWKVPKIPPDPELRARLEQELESHGVDALYSRLQELDPDVAAGTDAKNHRRVIRALERIASGVQQANRTAVDPGYNSLLIGLHVERAELHRRIADRVDGMIAAGWLDEVKRLIDAGIDFDSPALSAIGYREMAAVVRGEIKLEEARERTIRATNRLVRHQNNWFKQTDPRIKWVDVTNGDLTSVIEPVQKWIDD